ncbi:hypothetical protein ABZ590_18595, partial [Streptomyces hirsutus]
PLDHAGGTVEQGGGPAFVVGGVVAPVLLDEAGPRHSDAQDLFVAGRRALVEAVLHDVDGGVHIAVTLEDDPGADIRREQGRYLYFQPDEVGVVKGEETP